MKQSLTAQCIAGLLLGILGGIVVSQVRPEWIADWIGVADITIRGWTNALRLIVTPLVVAHLFVAISAHRSGKGDAAKLGVSIPSVFAGLLVFTTIIAVAAASALLAVPLLGGLSLANLSGADVAAAGSATGGAGWLEDLIPPNLVAAAARPEAILGLMLFTLAFAGGARRLATELHQVLEAGVRAVRDTLFILVGWLLRLAPILLLALGFRSASRSGLGVGHVLLAFIAIEVGVLLICIGALYPMAVLGGGVPLRRFARSVFPAQVTAASTRSSLASVPVLLREADVLLGVPSTVSALVIPLGGATLKLSRAVSSPVKLLFLAHLLGITLSPGQIAVFAITIILLSPSTVGVPSVVSGTRSLPAFVAVGIPPEYVILLGAMTAVVDVFLTVLNTTGYMTATALVSRLVASKTASPAGVRTAGAEQAGDSVAGTGG